ncbi:MAG: phr [Thermoleophilia bacterium]|nr:phr [Thermoleophilia bacterium]
MRTYLSMDVVATPWTPTRQARAERVLDALGALVCAPERVLAWNEVEAHDPLGACVVYWMARAQRGVHNLALDCAVDAACGLGVPLVVVFRRFRGPDHATDAHVAFMLDGLDDAFADCAARGATVLLVERDGPSLESLLSVDGLRPALVVVDDDVMPRARRGRERVAAALTVPLVSVDADVVVPGACFPKQEYAARTIRPKLHRVLDRYIDELGADGHGSRAPEGNVPDVAAMWPGIVDRTGARGGASSASSGTAAARRQLATFVETHLHGYASARNRPELDATSRLSHFVRFGQLAAHEAVRAVRDSGAPQVDVDTFIEEFVVRRELAYNFVRWNPLADRLTGAPDWAQRTLAAHASDQREWLWDDDALEAGDTHDPLWNAAQRQLVERGHMHGYVRMYWAKKILEWRADPADAFEVTLRLNDRYSLDGRDPNGIVGVAWAIAGVHDRAWTERPIFGMIRYMSLASTGRKFDSKAYVATWGGVRGEAVRDPGRYAGLERLF